MGSLEDEFIQSVSVISFVQTFWQSRLPSHDAQTNRAAESRLLW